MMNRNLRRFLTASVSIPALTAVPVLAATSTLDCTPIGCSQIDNAGDPVSDLTLVITAIGDDEDYGGGTLVSGPVDGQIFQSALV